MSSIARVFLHPLTTLSRAGLVGSCLLGCSTPRQEPTTELASTSSALSVTMTRTLGFESLPDWHVLVPGPRIELSSVHSEGNSSLALWNGGWMQVESRLGKLIDLQLAQEIPLVPIKK